MDSTRIDEALARTIEDHKLSRSERQALAALLEEVGPDPAERTAFRRRAFEAARAAIGRPEAAPILDWLEEVVKVLHATDPAPGPAAAAEAHFSPGDDCPRVIAGMIGRARRSIDVCVFTITDDRLAGALIEAHARGVAVRVLTDGDKAGDLGSDADRLLGAGVPVRFDSSPFHMHHKFAVFDAHTLLAGSYNWTRGAARDNHESLIVTGDPRLIGPFSATFERLWSAFA